jgi:hypothetical protein
MDWISTNPGHNFEGDILGSGCWNECVGHSGRSRRRKAAFGLAPPSPTGPEAGPRKRSKDSIKRKRDQDDRHNGRGNGRHAREWNDCE